MFTVFRECFTQHTTDNTWRGRWVHRPQGNKKYASYEEAKQAIRRWIRKHYKNWNTKPWVGTNPNIGDFGYFIKKV